MALGWHKEGCGVFQHTVSVCSSVFLVLSSQILIVSLPLMRTMTHPIAAVLEIQALPEAQVGGDHRRKDPTFKSIAVTGCQDMGQ